MYSFHFRHQVDKQAEGYSVGEKGYPSNGRIDRLFGVEMQASHGLSRS